MLRGLVLPCIGIYTVLLAFFAFAFAIAPACTAGDPTARCAAIHHHHHH